jgi:hypothetical protein
MFLLSLYTLLFNKLNDKDFLIVMYILPVLFLTAFTAIVPNIIVLSICHCAIVTCLGLGTFVDDFIINLTAFLTLAIFRLLWCVYGSCIMFREGESWGLEIPVEISTWLWTIIFGYKLWRRIP